MSTPVIYIENITYQGRPPGSTHPGGWSVTLGEVVTRFGKTTVDLSDPMTPEEAAAQGFSMPEILASVNGQAQTALDAANARIAELEAQIAAASAVVPGEGETLSSGGAPADGS